MMRCMAKPPDQQATSDAKARSQQCAGPFGFQCPVKTALRFCKWIDVSQRNYALHQRGCMAVIEQSTNALIGFCGLVAGDTAGEIELIYALAPSHWGRGYAFESAGAMLEYGLTILPRIHASIYAANKASQRVLEKLGFAQTRVEPDDTIFFQFRSAVSA